MKCDHDWATVITLCGTCCAMNGKEHQHCQRCFRRRLPKTNERHKPLDTPTKVAKFLKQVSDEMACEPLDAITFVQDERAMIRAVLVTAERIARYHGESQKQQSDFHDGWRKACKAIAQECGYLADKIWGMAEGKQVNK